MDLNKPEHRSSNAGDVSLLFGILSIPFAIVIFCGVIAIAFGIVGWISTSKSKGFPRRSRTAIAGIILGVLSFGLIAFLKYDEAQMRIRVGIRTALPVATALESAVNNFQAEYGKLPETAPELKTDTPEGIQLLTILLGLEKSAPQKNLRSIKFLSVREGKDKKRGLIYSESGYSIEGLYDFWGNPFTIQMDTDNDETLRFKLGGKAIELKGRRVAAYSPGPDKLLGTKDDVKTW